MGCLPESGGCERHRTEPFAHHLNELEGKHFSHATCLDRVYRNSPQPEILYIDPGTAEQLVIERKTLVWPLDYAERHKAYHDIADYVLSELGELTTDASYALMLQSDIAIGRQELKDLARAIVAQVKAQITAVRRGDVIGSVKRGQAWRFSLEASEERTDFSPPKGLIIRWPQRLPGFFYNPHQLPTRLEAEIGKCLQACARKFSEYVHHRRVLLLDQYGELRHVDAWWWARVFARIAPPKEISEIWLATFDWITEWDQTWIFERLYPAFSPQERDSGA
jgi:hypothetical protein